MRRSRPSALDDEFGRFEHRDVLLHGRERHRVLPRELRDRLLLGEGAPKNVTPGLLRQCVENAIEVRIVESGIYNHLVSH
jgi:hypothetical protein